MHIIKAHQAKVTNDLLQNDKTVSPSWSPLSKKALVKLLLTLLFTKTVFITH